MFEHFYSFTHSVFLPFYRRGTFLGSHLHAMDNQKIHHKVIGHQYIGIGLGNPVTDRQTAPCDPRIEDIL